MLEVNQSAIGSRMLTTVMVKQSTGNYALLLANYDRALNATVRVSFLTGMHLASITTLTAPTLDSVDGITFGGATMGLNGAWIGNVSAMFLPVIGGSLTVFAPAHTVLMIQCT